MLGFKLEWRAAVGLELEGMGGMAKWREAST